MIRNSAILIFLLSGFNLFSGLPFSLGQDANFNNHAISSLQEKRQLFDGKTLEGWHVTNFGGEGECTVQDGILILEPGFPLTGVNSALEDLPTTNYEVVVEAQRAEGNDFFCGLTFPVADSHCCLIVGGWAGATVGLSNIDDLDASRNETRKVMKFENERWYRIRVRVSDAKIEAWIDDEQVVDLETKGRKINLRNETLPTRPLGICAFQSLAKIRKVELKKTISAGTNAQMAECRVNGYRIINSAND